VKFYDWSAASMPGDFRLAPADGFYRFVTSFATTEAEIEALLLLIAKLKD